MAVTEKTCCLMQASETNYYST